MKKIAMFSGEVSAEYQYRICETVSAECKKEGIQLTVFHNFTSYGSNVFHSYGEKSVIRIPDLKRYDGFLLMSDVLGVEGMREELIALLKEVEAPVIFLREENENFYNILVDDYTAMSHMVEHFITEHGLTRICFMKGKKELKDAQVRFQAYLDVMQKYNLKVTEHMTFDGDYWKNKGDEAVNWFWDSVEEKPQAIVCANDYMAISVQNALRARGVRIPEDVCLSGYDDREEARFSVPSITSMHVEDEQLARTAVEMFLRIWDGKQEGRTEVVTAEGRFRESCGCRTERDTQEQLQLFQTKEHLQLSLSQAAFMNVDCGSCNSLEDLIRQCSNFIRFGGPNAKVYVCFCDEEEKKAEKAEMEGKYTEYMELYAIMQADNVVFCRERFRREMILPERYLDGYETLYVNPLHDKNNCLGYFVVVPGFVNDFRYLYQSWIQVVTNNMIKLQMYKEGQMLADTIDQYNLDELTGIPNRRKLDAALKNAHTMFKKEGKSYFIASIDMDGLKYINDHFGHVVGDEALCALAGILSREVGETGIVARTGGDEFIICYKIEDDKIVERQIQSIRNSIDKYNAESDKPYELSASIGYVKCEKDMRPINCIQIADEIMYREKRSKKKNMRTE